MLSGDITNYGRKLEFENAKLNIQLAFDEKGKVVGLFFTPVEAAESAEKYQSPAYAKPELFTEKEVTVGSGELSLPATLTMPMQRMAMAV